MHVLGVELDRGGEEVQVVAQRVEQVPGVASMMGSEALVVVATDDRRWHETAILRNVVGTPHAYESAFPEVLGTSFLERQRVDQAGQIVRVARDDLQELVHAAFQRAVVDTASIGFPETEFAPLGDESESIGHEPLVVVGLVLGPHAARSAIDHDSRALDGFDGLVAGFHTEVLEALDRGFVHAELGSAMQQGQHLGSVCEQRRAFVEGDLLDAELSTQPGKQSDQGLADGTRADHVHDRICAHGSRLLGG